MKVVAAFFFYLWDHGWESSTLGNLFLAAFHRYNIKCMSNVQTLK